MIIDLEMIKISCACQISLNEYICQRIVVDRCAILAKILKIKKKVSMILNHESPESVVDPKRVNSPISSETFYKCKLHAFWRTPC
jgi:hypothetical protein